MEMKRLKVLCDIARHLQERMLISLNVLDVIDWSLLYFSSAGTSVKLV